MTGNNITWWFQNEVFWWRTFAALTWGVILQFCGISITIFLALFSPWTPLQWIYATVGNLVTPSSWFLDALVVGTTLSLGTLFSRQFSLTPTVLKSRLSLIVKMMEPQLITSLAVHVGGGGVLMRCYLGLLGGPYSNLSVPCNKGSELRCLNASNVFLVLSGCFMGFCQWAEYHFSNGNLVTFPTINQAKSSQLRLQLPFLLRNAAYKVALNLRWFYISYFLIGYRVEPMLMRVLRIQQTFQPESGIFSGVGVWLKLDVFVRCWLLNSLLVASISILKTVLTLFLTEPVVFESPVDNSPVLLEAMESKFELLRHLAFHDFSKMAMNSPTRRADFYKLSQPGGHPHNWNKAHQLCVSAITQFMADLNETTQPKTKPKEVKPVESTEGSLRMRKLAPSRSVDQAQDQKKEAAEEAFSLRGLFSKTWSRVSKNPIFSNYPEADQRQVFARSQIVIWAVEGLSHLVVASLTEDRYGVVQKELSDVMATILNLEQTIERHRGMSAKKNKFDSRDIQLKNELRDIVKKSLFRITVAFGEHTSHLDLPNELHQRVKSYRNFMEG